MRKAILILALLSPAQSAAQRSAQSASDVRLYARVLEMTDTRSFDRQLLDSALASGWEPLRAFAALSMGQVGALRGSAGTALLRSLLSDRDARVAANAAYALGLLVDSASVGALQSALSAPAPVAREAAWALGEIGAPARAAILAALATPPADDPLAIQLLLAASKLRPVPVAEVRPFLSMHARPSVVWAASYAIARNRAPAGVRDLIALSARLDSARASSRGEIPAAARGQQVGPEAFVIPAVAALRTRAEIARALARTSAGDSLADPAFNVLRGLASDGHPHVRINALRSLGSFGARARDLLVAAARDRDANVRITAVQSIGPALDSTVASWTALWALDTGFTYRSSLLASASRAGARLPAISEWSAAPDWQRRLAALVAQATFAGREGSVRLAREALRDADGRVRAGAYALLAPDTIAPGAEARQVLLSGLEDRDLHARAAVIAVLGRRAAGRDLPAVLDAYERSLTDKENDARLAAIQYVAAAWRRDSAGIAPDVRLRLAALRTPDDPLLRAAARDVPALAGWQDAKGNPRPGSWYQAVVREYVVPALAGRTQRVSIRTPRGEIVLELFGADAPITVRNFMELARSGYYRGTVFHRVVPNFVAQDGDPRGDGSGGPGYAIRDEINRWRYERGVLGMALSGPDTGGSQYFITHSPQPHLDGHYTIFGRVLSGLGALDAVVQGDAIRSISVR